MPEIYSKITMPITGDNPFGEDARYNLDFDRLKNEMEKLSGIDLDSVESLSVKILTEKSKDVRAMVWLAYVMVRLNDLERLADVFSALAYYCQEDRFDSVFPARENAKKAALSWFSESRFSGLCEKITVSAADVHHLARLHDALTELRVALDKRFSDNAPPMSSLYKYALDWKKAAEADTKPLAANNAGNAGPAQPATQGTSRGSRDAARVDDGKDVVIKLTGEQYRELSDSMQKIKTLLKI